MLVKQIRHNNKRPPQPEEPKMCLVKSKAAFQEESVEGRKACKASLMENKTRLPCLLNNNFFCTRLTYVLCARMR